MDVASPAPPWAIDCQPMIDSQVDGRSLVENSAYTAFVRRVIRAHGRRVAAGEPVDLAELVGLRDDFDQVIREAVRGMRQRHGYSWTDIGRELGISRQAAQQLYGRRR